MTGSEVWKDVVGYEGFYKVSNKGNVYSVERKSSIGRKCGGRTLRPVNHKDGYLHISLSKNDTRKQKLIHRLVAEAFIPNHNNYLEINHKDEDKTNNYVENLEWCTREHNINHGKRTEKASQTQSKRVKAVNVETGEVIAFKSITEAMNRGYSSAVSKACRGIYKSPNGNLMGGDGHTYKGHKWSYEEEEINEKK